MSVYDTLARLGVELPAAGAPAAAYVMAATTGNTVFLSGHRPQGRQALGRQARQGYRHRTGKQAARIAIDLLATLHAHIGDLNPRQAHRQGDEPGELPRIHRTSGHQRLLRVLAEVFGEPASTHAARSAWRRFRWAPASKSK
jgi:hypothetical protein